MRERCFHKHTRDENDFEKKNTKKLAKFVHKSTVAARDFKANGKYEIIPATNNPLNSVTVDMVLQELFEEEELEEEEDSDVESDAYEGDESESGSDED